MRGKANISIHGYSHKANMKPISMMEVCPRSSSGNIKFGTNLGREKPNFSGLKNLRINLPSGYIACTRARPARGGGYIMSPYWDEKSQMGPQSLLPLMLFLWGYTVTRGGVSMKHCNISLYTLVKIE